MHSAGQFMHILAEEPSYQYVREDASALQRSLVHRSEILLREDLGHREVDVRGIQRLQHPEEHATRESVHPDLAGTGYSEERSRRGDD